ncbi:metallophosphoesterase [Streptomyces sp. NPDC050564]|uniref:metallophosphoesterase n=1 Tax=Streptomyces sp. NPDC050564 TaxID=3365631 RepID=UPI0037BB218E
MVIVFVLVGLVALAVLGALHWYAWRRLVRDTTSGPGVARRVGAAVFVAGPLLMFGAVASERAGAPFWLQRVLAWPGFLWMALAIYLVLALVVGELVRPVVRRVVERRAVVSSARVDSATSAVSSGGASASAVSSGAASASAVSSGGASAAAVSSVPAVEGESGPRRSIRPRPGAESAGFQEAGVDAPAAAGGPSGASPSAASAGAGRPPSSTGSPSRRLFVSRMVGGAAAAAAVGTVGYGTYGVLRGPRVKRVTVPLAKLPRSAHGFRIAVVSDIHLGPVLGRGFAQKVVDTINSTQPDLIAVVGDLVDGSVKDLGPAAAPLARLRSRFGSYFVTGNHEYFSGAEQWVREVRGLGIHPLENARTELAGFDLAGVNDVQGESEGQAPDFGKALGDRDTSRACVLLAHQPVQIHEAVRHGVDLQLSGHTHGGQLWPGNFIAGAANPTLAGLERYGDTQLYVSRGAGAWGPPTRVGAPSDITVVELASRQA